jgi:hypothetical protein
MGEMEQMLPEIWTVQRLERSGGGGLILGVKQHAPGLPGGFPLLAPDLRLPQGMPQIAYNLTRVVALAFLITALPFPGLAANEARPTIVNTTITNALTRYLTNVIEVSVPKNVFVDQYRTNQVRREVVNVIDLYKTNIVAQYRTNLLTVTLTNWENLVVIRTNWVTQAVTNVVEFTRTNLVRHTVTTTNVVTRPETAQPTLATAAASPAAPRAADLERGLELDLTHVGAPKEPGQFPIRLTLLSATGDTLPVIEWQVEKSNGGGLMVGAKTEFATVLPAGNYRITARVRTDDGTVKKISSDTEVKTDASAMRTPASLASGR